MWGSTYIAIKVALTDLPPFFQMSSRFLVAGGILIIWARFVRGEQLPTRQQWRVAAVIGVLLLGGGAGLTAYAEQTVASGLIATFIAIEPAMIICGNWLSGRSPSRIDLTSVVVGIVGVALLVRNSGFSAFNRSVGTDGSVGNWHETYVVSRGAYENLYVNMPSFGMGKAGQFQLASGSRTSAHERLRT